MTEYWVAGPLAFNIVRVDLSDTSLTPMPAVANKSVEYQLQPLDQMASQNTDFVVGINGGYFFRDDLSDFIDNVCRGKTRAQALEPVSAENPDYGIGDSLVKANGTLLASNCDDWGYNMPTVLVIDGVNSYIKILGKGMSCTSLDGTP